MMNLPNKLTIARVAAIPFIIAALYQNAGSWRLIALILFCLASFTDFLDGYLARKNNIVTDFGKLLDPIADKLLVLSTMIMFTYRGMMIAWVVILILSRELAVDGLRSLAASKGKVIAAGQLGKIKTCSQIALILWMMISGIPVMSHWSGIVLTAWVVFITLWSGVDYYYRNMNLITSK